MFACIDPALCHGCNHEGLILLIFMSLLPGDRLIRCSITILRREIPRLNWQVFQTTCLGGLSHLLFPSKSRYAGQIDCMQRWLKLLTTGGRFTYQVCCWTFQLDGGEQLCYTLGIYPQRLFNADAMTID